MKLNSNSYKRIIVFIIPILFFLTLINYLSFQKKIDGFTQPLILIDSSENNIDASRYLRNLYSPIDSSKVAPNLKEFSLIILLSNSGCNPCQTRELNLIDSLFHKKFVNLAIIPIFLGEQKIKILQLKKVSNFRDTIFYSKNIEDFPDIYSNRFPIIILLHKDKFLYLFRLIYESHQPSLDFYNKFVFRKLIQNSIDLDN